jgi:hypothetical protein
MKKLLERIEFLIYLTQQIYKFLQDHPGALQPLTTAQVEFISVQQLADKCYVNKRQVERWLHDEKIKPSKYIGSSPYFATDYIEDALLTGKLRIKKRRPES